MLFWLAIPALSWLPPSSIDAVAADPPAAQHPRTILVLSGGGARGMAHIGVLETLEQQRVPVDAIVGTSMGAIVGGLYASGVSPEEMRRSLLRIDWEDTFNDAPSRKLLPIRRKEEDLLPLFELEAGFNRHGFGFPSGLVAGQKLNFILQTMFLRSVNCTSFDDLPIPFRAIATDLETGEMVVLDHGDLPTAIRASMAFPVLFTPVKYDDRLLVDGGVVRNLAVDVALDMGAERIIAVDVGSTLGDLKSGTPTAFGVLRRTQSVMAQATRAEQLADLRDQDILIVPQLDGLVSFSDFDRVDAAIDRGVSAAEGQARRLETFAVPQAAYDAYLKRQRAGAGLDPIRVESIEIRGAHRVDPRRIRDRIRTRVGGTLDVKTLREDLQRVYLIGEFELVEFHLEPSTEGKRFVVDVEEKSWGPWYVRGGIGLATNFSGDSAFVVLGLLRRTELNRLGAEWRSLVSIGEVDGFETDLYQPVTYKGTVFVNPRLYTIRTKNERATFGDVEFAIDSRASAIELDVGTLLSNWGEFRLGVFAGRTTNAPLEPIPGDPDLGRDLGGFVVGARYDRLDNSHFPAHGQLGVLAGRFSRPGVGADDEYDRVELRLAQAESFGRNTLLGRLALGTDLGSDLPFYDDFELGGFQNLSGLDRDALRGSRLALAALTFYRQVRRKPGLFGARYYVGASLEAGNAWASGEDATLGSLIGAGSVFVGADTLLGPLYLGYGHTDDGRESLYLFLGRLF